MPTPITTTMDMDSPMLPKEPITTRNRWKHRAVSAGQYSAALVQSQTVYMLSVVLSLTQLLATFMVLDRLARNGQESLLSSSSSLDKSGVKRNGKKTKGKQGPLAEENGSTARILPFGNSSAGTSTLRAWGRQLSLWPMGWSNTTLGGIQEEGQEQEDVSHGDKEREEKRGFRRARELVRTLSGHLHPMQNKHVTFQFTSSEKLLSGSPTSLQATLAATPPAITVIPVMATPAQDVSQKAKTTSSMSISPASSSSNSRTSLSLGNHTFNLSRRSRSPGRPLSMMESDELSAHAGQPKGGMTAAMEREGSSGSSGSGSNKSGKNTFIYRVTHPQKYKREMEQQVQQQKDVAEHRLSALAQLEGQSTVEETESVTITTTAVSVATTSNDPPPASQDQSTLLRKKERPSSLYPSWSTSTPPHSSSSSSGTRTSRGRKEIESDPILSTHHLLPAPAMESSRSRSRSRSRSPMRIPLPPSIFGGSSSSSSTSTDQPSTLPDHTSFAAFGFPSPPAPTLTPPTTTAAPSPFQPPPVLPPFPSPPLSPPSKSKSSFFMTRPSLTSSTSSSHSIHAILSAAPITLEHTILGLSLQAQQQQQQQQQPKLSVPNSNTNHKNNHQHRRQISDSGVTLEAMLRQENNINNKNSKSATPTWVNEPPLTPETATTATESHTGLLEPSGGSSGGRGFIRKLSISRKKRTTSQ